MDQNGHFLFLGCGASMGVPVVGCSCEVCRSTSPFNKRLRSSGVLQIYDKNILIDVGPDFRCQALFYKISHIDGVIITHTHYDHIGGIDDLRIFYLIQRKELSCLLSKNSFDDLKKRYDYLFRPTSAYANLTARFDFQILPEERGQIEFAEIPFTYMTYLQGGMKVNGLRVGQFAYVSDIRDFPETIFEDLEGVETLVVSALRQKPSHVHFNLDEAVEFSRRVGAKQTWLTHLGHELDYFEANAYLPPEVRLAYDGLIIHFSLDSV
jgi:phosphoribosyl 1,2-cyclic phosphate phosphodiesterase